jgi:hypothetical protein
MIKRFFGINPWKRNPFGCLVYAGSNLATRKRYFKGLNIPQPFIKRPDLVKKEEAIVHHA